jgi:DNA-binding protein H-NS
MKSYKQLMEEKRAVDDQLAHEVVRSRDEAVALVRRLIQTFKLAPYEVFSPAHLVRRSRKRPEPIYRDPVSGATWSGRGKTPLWIRNAIDKEALRMKPHDTANASRNIAPQDEPAR